MKRILLTLGAILIVVTMSVSAQNRRGNNGNAGQRMTVESRVDRMATELELTNKQKTELTKFFKEMDEALQKGMSTNREELTAQVEKMNAELKTILGDEKYEKWQSMRSERTQAARRVTDNKSQPEARPQQAQQPRQGNRQFQMPTPEQQADRLAQRLKLSDNQKKELVEFYTKQQANREARRNDAAASMEARRAEMEKVQAAEDAELLKIIGQDKADELKKYREETRRQFQNQRR